jgi:hypothetical protein
LIEQPLRRAEQFAMLASCAALSAVAVLWSWMHDAMLNYGDAVAHLHIARRVIDSHYPGLTQLGSVWLPLPHLLLIPFVAIYSWWANGIAGAIPSSLAYLAGCAGLYRLARFWVGPPAAAVALVFFAANPNLLYLQTTAMTEPLFLCELIWSVVWLVEWHRSLDDDSSCSASLLWKIAIVLVAAIFTRYDGWVLAFLAWASVAVVLLRRGEIASRTYWLATAVVVAAPITWFLYNAAVFGDWLDFARGPYSAKAIELRTATRGSGPPHPGWHNPWVSLIFFIKSAEQDATAADWGNKMFVVTSLGTIGAYIVARRKAIQWAFLLWLPVPFYAYSVAYGSVPIFLPVWWPHSWYNTRYGLELLPAFALGLGLVAQFILAAAREFRTSWVKYAAALLFALAGWNTWKVLREGPLTYIEGTKNVESRRILDEQIPPVLRTLLASRPGEPVLMETSVFPEIVALTGIPLRQTINESDRSFYSNALAAPAAHAAIVLAFDGDEVDRAVRAHPAGLTLVRRFSFTGQPNASVYVSDTSGLNKVLVQW